MNSDWIFYGLLVTAMMLGLIVSVRRYRATKALRRSTWRGFQALVIGAYIVLVGFMAFDSPIHGIVLLVFALLLCAPFALAGSVMHGTRSGALREGVFGAGMVTAVFIAAWLGENHLQHARGARVLAGEDRATVDRAMRPLRARTITTYRNCAELKWQNEYEGYDEIAEYTLIGFSHSYVFFSDGAALGHFLCYEP